MRDRDDYSTTLSWCRVGARVVCIAVFPGRECERDKGVVDPIYGMQYTIREVSVFEGSNGRPKVGVRLVELQNPSIRYREREQEKAYTASAFSPVVEDDVEATIFAKKRVDA